MMTHVLVHGLGKQGCETPEDVAGMGFRVWGSSFPNIEVRVPNLENYPVGLEPDGG